MPFEKDGYIQKELKKISRLNKWTVKNGNFIVMKFFEIFFSNISPFKLNSQKRDSF